MTANATGMTVIAGPDEATGLGNIVVQLIAAGVKSKDIKEGARAWWPRPSAEDGIPPGYGGMGCAVPIVRQDHRGLKQRRSLENRACRILRTETAGL